MASVSSKVQLKIITGPSGANKVYTLLREGSPGRVVFFVGDQLESSRNHRNIYQLQDPKNQAVNLAHKFPDSSVLVVMPSRLEAGWACFDHFLHKTTESGEPLGYGEKNEKAILQILSILDGCGLGLSRRAEDFLRLAGFSKGGVVLNQVLAEMSVFQKYLQDPREHRQGRNDSLLVSSTPDYVRTFLSAIQEMHFLDVGLNCKGAYLTNEKVLESLGNLNRSYPFTVFLHGTPRQWDDVYRGWICIEKNRFKALLCENRIRVIERKYLEGEEPSILMHFEVLEIFSPKRVS